MAFVTLPIFVAVLALPIFFDPQRPILRNFRAKKITITTPFDPLDYVSWKPECLFNLNDIIEQKTLLTASFKKFPLTALTQIWYMAHSAKFYTHESGQMAMAREIVSRKRLTRMQVMLTEEELKALDNFRFKKRMPSRAAAIREILRRGLMADGFEIADGGARSNEFGVIRDESDSGPAGEAVTRNRAPTNGR